MGIISVASGNSSWRGLDYYKNNNVIKLNKISNFEYSSIVSGRKKYKVYLNIQHPRNSTCNCPFFNGKRIICKHIVATYFAALPKEAIKFEEEQRKLQEEHEEYNKNELYDKCIEYINKMSKNELIHELINVFDYGPEWVYNNFLKRHNLK